MMPKAALHQEIDKHLLDSMKAISSVVCAMNVDYKRS